MSYYCEKEAKKLVLQSCRELVEHKLIVRTWGNVSARVEGDRIAITPSGRDYDTLTEDDIVITDMEGKYKGDILPSSEIGVHLECYSLRPDVNFVIHTHQTFASALSVLGMDIRLGTRVSERARELIGPRIVCASYGLNGSKKLRQAVGYAIETNPLTNHVLMKNHGALCLGTDHDRAFHIALTLERLSEKIYDYYCTDGAPLLEQLKQRKAQKAAMQAEDTAEAMKEMSVPDEPITIAQSIPEGLETSDERYGAWMLHVMTPYVLKMSQADCTVKAYLDDMAQITGPSVKCVSSDISRDDFTCALGKSNAIMVEGKGAYCFGPTYDEALFVAEVLEKNCTAAYLASIRGVEPLSIIDAMIDRIKYTKKYSKLKEIKPQV